MESFISLLLLVTKDGKRFPIFFFLFIPFQILYSLIQSGENGMTLWYRHENKITLPRQFSLEVIYSSLFILKQVLYKFRLQKRNSKLFIFFAQSKVSKLFYKLTKRNTNRT